MDCIRKTGDEAVGIAASITPKTSGDKHVLLGAIAAILTVIGVSAQTRQFDRQTLLAAVKDHIKAQPELLEPAARSWQGIAVVTPVSDAFRQYLSNEPPGEAWQRDLIAIPALKASPPTGWKATFEIALAYLASAETRTPPPALLTNLEGPNPNNIQGYGQFHNFVKDLLAVMLDENKPCSFQGFYLGTPTEVQFANSICTDLKRTVHDARQEYAALHVPSVRPSDVAKEPVKAQPGQSSLPPSSTTNQVSEAATPVNTQQPENMARLEPQTSPLVHPEPARQGAPATGGSQPSPSSKAAASNVHRPAVRTGRPDGFLGLPIDSGFAIGMIVLFTLIIAVYCLPALIAFSRRHRNRWVILAINLAFGATLIGWVIALVWALNKIDAPVKGGWKYDPQPNDPIL